MAGGRVICRITGNLEAEATLQRQRGLVPPNAAVFTNTTERRMPTRHNLAFRGVRCPIAFL